MNFRNPYAYSVYSIICVLTFCFLLFHILERATDVDVIIHGCLQSTMLAILGGITLLLCGLFERGYLQRSFVYNLVATFNLIVGGIGTFFLLVWTDRIPNLIALNLIVGALMYRNIFKR